MLLNDSIDLAKKKSSFLSPAKQVASSLLGFLFLLTMFSLVGCGVDILEDRVVANSPTAISTELPIIYLATEGGVAITSKDDYVRGTVSFDGGKY
jgi:hypothetical protein